MYIYIHIYIHIYTYIYVCVYIYILYLHTIHMSMYFPNSELLISWATPMLKSHFVQKRFFSWTWRWIAGDVEDEEDDGNDETVPWSC